MIQMIQIVNGQYFIATIAPPGNGPSSAPDNRRGRRQAGDRRWSRYERPLDAVDVTDYAGTAALVEQTGLTKVGDQSRR
jgi:hypothetical protein